ncbi:Cys-Cys-COOH (seleno)protein SaoC [Tissierella praeacuta]|uniref:Cys-Cys-COOH (seleno)protein SaoC n=1 Tax=Tissierella praeacuta TaxID=43131 RepID=UPI0028A85173|nr:Cys-Cys-COOH (seleno)protein SaoC [Tissierella praeacuta]
MKKKIKVLLIALIIFSLGLFIYIEDNRQKLIDFGVDYDNELLLHFKENFPDNEVIKCGYEDLNGDGIKDLLIIYNVSRRKNEMLVVIDYGDGYKFSESTPAPLDNQKIEFKDIDKTPPMEVIVSGSKDGNFGYAIFRLIDDTIFKDLFGEGMEDCC